jgi:hypothetical protein
LKLNCWAVLISIFGRCKGNFVLAKDFLGDKMKKFIILLTMILLLGSLMVQALEPITFTYKGKLILLGSIDNSSGTVKISIDPNQSKDVYVAAVEELSRQNIIRDNMIKIYKNVLTEFLNTLKKSKLIQ